MTSIGRDLFYSIFPNKNSYLTSGMGNSPIILSAPHGGNIKPIDIPYREHGNRSRDTYTRTLIQAIVKLLSEKPFYIYANIHRSRVDLNRDIDEAAQGNNKAIEIWKSWNNTLGNFQARVKSVYSKGLYIDIHSHNNSHKFEIGYGLTVSDYLDLKGGWEITRHSTLFPLATQEIKEKNLCFGYNSVPYTLESFGYDILVPENDDEYLNGGRNSKVFHGNGIGSIQIECPIPVLKDDLDGVAKALASSINSFRKSFL